MHRDSPCLLGNSMGTVEKPAKGIKRGTTQLQIEDLSGQVTRARAATEALLSTASRIVSAMPVVVDYPATIHSVRQIGAEDEILFVTSLWGESGDHPEQSWRVEHLDVYKIRDEFLALRTPREALNFLRETGRFLPGGTDVSWRDFERWQRYAEIVMERKQLIEFMKASFSQRSTAKIDPSGDLKQISLMLTGIYPHNYFGRSEQSLSPETLASLRRSAEITSKTPHEAERNYRETLNGMEKERDVAHDRQRTLETWFYEPPDSACSIKFIPRHPDEEFFRNIQRGGALLDYIHPLEDLIPVLVIKPACTVEAIAAAIYAERLAGIKCEKCPGCGFWFEVGSQQKKTYCSEKCRERLKKRRQRDSTNETRMGKKAKVRRNG
jgi:hypothetical protein